ncbi:MAG: hypothetical protein DMF13_02410 [Verrucomicrobia bacterium]|nr:MAG: hypothetical protein DMF13_02410 [Verrucomicrobiota bacterium]
MKTDGRDGGEVQLPRQRVSGAAQKLTQFSSGLSRPFIQRPVMTMLLTVSVLVFGILSYNQLAVNDLPAVDYPVISVTASYPGADPVTMANTIATPLEKQFTQIPGISLISAKASMGRRVTCNPQSSAPADNYRLICPALRHLPRQIPMISR